MNIMRGKTIRGFKKLVVGLFNLFISIENTTMRIFEIFLLHFISFFSKTKNTFTSIQTQFMDPGVKIGPKLLKKRLDQDQLSSKKRIHFSICIN